MDSVSSPTFIIVNVYRGTGRSQLFHMDAYRLDSAPEAEELDLDAMLAQGPLIIEWPERMETLIPGERLWVQLDYIDDETRRMQFQSSGRRYDELLDLLRSAIAGGE